MRAFALVLIGRDVSQNWYLWCGGVHGYWRCEQIGSGKYKNVIIEIKRSLITLDMLQFQMKPMVVLLSSLGLDIFIVG